MMDTHEFEEFIRKQKFRKAVTAKRNPHEYTIRKDVVGTDKEYIDACRFIRMNGFTIRFWRQEDIVYCLDKRFYWTIE